MRQMRRTQIDLAQAGWQDGTSRRFRCGGDHRPEDGRERLDAAPPLDSRDVLLYSRARRSHGPGQHAQKIRATKTGRSAAMAGETLLRKDQITE